MLHQSFAQYERPARRLRLVNDAPLGQNAPCRYEEGDYCLDSGLRALVYRGDIVKLTPRSFRLLEYLFENRSRVVSNAEVLSAIWPEGAAPQSLRQEVYALRKNLKEYGADSCVVTVSQFGYRFESSGSVRAVTSATKVALNLPNRRALAIATYYAEKRDNAHLLRALAWYTKVVHEYPQVQEAHIGALRVVTTLALRSAIAPDAAYAKARAHIAAILDREPANRDVRVYQAFMSVIFKKNIVAGIAELEALRRSSPANSEVLHFLALAYLLNGQHDKAIFEQTAAIAVDPTSLELHSDLGLIQTFAGDYNLAKTHLRFLHKLDPQNPNSVARLAAIHVLQGEHDEAIGLLQSIVPNVPSRATLCVALARSGRRQEAQAVLDGLQQDRTQMFVSGYFLAKAHVALGDHEQALAMLREAQGEPLTACLARDPWFVELRGLAEFDARNTLEKKKK